MPHPIDEYVGTKVRLTRAAKGISQQQLGQMLNISFQQVQKYERGTNRISVSRLWEIAEALDVDMQHFFEGADKSSRNSFEGLSTRTIKLASQINQIADTAVRNQIVGLIEACRTPAE